jgi:hypothetical protein
VFKPSAIRSSEQLDREATPALKFASLGFGFDRHPTTPKAIHATAATSPHVIVRVRSMRSIRAERVSPDPTIYTATGFL